MSEALRFNNDKPMMSYFMRSFPKMAEAVARVKEMGAVKYNDDNWRLGNKPDKEYWDSMFRHLTYIFNGEDYDKDTGCLHIAHAVWNMCALLELNYPDLPARDEAIWEERAAHWAAEKRKREASDEVETVEEIGADFVARWAAEAKRKQDAEWRENPRFVGDVLDELFGSGVNLPPAPESTEFVATEMPKPVSMTFSPLYTAFVEKLATRDKEIEAQYAAHCAEKRKREAADEAADEAAYYACWPDPDEFTKPIKPVWTTFVVKHGGEAYYVPPCPMCGHSDNILLNGERGMECPDCGEIFEVPIGPENEEFVISPNSKSGGVIIREAAEDAAEAVDEASYYACWADLPWLFTMFDNECPMCGSHAVWQGDCGRECRECGEIFEVPIVPENTSLHKDVKFVIRYAKPSPAFRALMDEIFNKTNWGRD